MARWWTAASWEMPMAWSLRRAEGRILGSGRSRVSLEKLWWSAAWLNGSSPAHSHRTKVSERGSDVMSVLTMVLNEQVFELIVWTPAGPLRSLWGRLTQVSSESSTQGSFSRRCSFIKCRFNFGSLLIFWDPWLHLPPPLCHFYPAHLFLPLTCTHTCTQFWAWNIEEDKLISWMFPLPSWIQVHGLYIESQCSTQWSSCNRALLMSCL